MKRNRWILNLTGILAGFGLLSSLVAAGSLGQSNSHNFTETGHTVSGVFWTYWQGHGGLAQQGYPISDEFTETSALNGKPYTVQYFERAVFEKHPENAAPYNVLLSQLGTFRYKALYGSGAAATPTPAPGTANATEFDFDFSPKTLTVPVGTKVIWTNRGPTEHTVADRAGSFGSDPLHPGDSYSHVFTTPGTYHIHCTLHAFMDMTVIVK